MSRLKDALAKAAGKHLPIVDAGTNTPAAPGADVVPTSWCFDEVELDVPVFTASEAAPQGETAPPHKAGASQPPTDPWHEYRFGRDFQEKIVVGPGADPGLVEQYRRLGAALHHHQLQNGARTVMIASAAAAEGKTLTAANLALTLSESYMRRVLLIDADLRQPSIHELLQLPRSPGLTESFLQPQPGSLPLHTVSPMLSVLTAGQPSSDPMSGLVSDTMNKIVAEAAERFDWVIVDTPPVALLPDANLLAAMIDTALLVVSAHGTPYPLVARAVQAIGAQRILGVVLNRIEKRELISSYNHRKYRRRDSPSKTKRRFGFLRRRRREESAAV